MINNILIALMLIVLGINADAGIIYWVLYFLYIIVNLVYSFFEAQE